MVKFALLQSILAAALTGLWIMGWLDEPFTGTSAVACWSLSGLLLIGLALAARGQYRGARYIMYGMTAFGLIGTVLGLRDAMLTATFTGEPQEVMAEIGHGMGVAINSTLFGLVGWRWLHFTLFLSRQAAEE